ncbi:MAG: hypothetical protein AUJ54_02955 [Ignavibacteria bacterium CG1_02_37_35]|nr:MAG: hypothetical protein AUJ54_02955 [Ignavibacteria bacterium CG1_02_37_35]
METLLTIFGIFVGAFITLFVQLYDQKVKFRLVAIEKRLSAHQEAFSQWYKLVWVIHTPAGDRIKVTNEVRNFWINNCLFLEKNTRKEFDIVIKLVDGYSLKLQIAKNEKDPHKKEELRQDYLNDWKRIFDLPNYIQSEVELKPIVPNIKISAEG